MTAVKALVEYGYAKDADGRYRQPGRRTQVWEETDGGWLRYDSENGAEVAQVHSVAEAFRGTSGLTKDKNPEAFDWVYPDDEVARIYKVALESRAVNARTDK